MLTPLVEAEAVPYLAAMRYTDSGLAKRGAWEATWEAQRREDAGEHNVVVALPGGCKAPTLGRPIIGDIAANWMCHASGLLRTQARRGRESRRALDGRGGMISSKQRHSHNFIKTPKTNSGPPPR